MSNYLPVLLCSVSANAIPDDSVLTALPRGQVDYLSHDWQEEDIARSWRSMTRRKYEIANGIRLENASWRTWWKQRNKLKTVSPETLNWLKDSDVTWLYGPLHTAADPPKSHGPPPFSSPIPSQAGPDSLDLTSSCRQKPILKHRSISELLTSDFPNPVYTTPDEDEDRPSRPALPHTKSDTHITRWPLNRPFRRQSPPRIIASEHGTGPTTFTVSGDSSSASEHDPTPSASTNPNGKKKHITFNTFVEQYISIDKPKIWTAKRRMTPLRRGGAGRRGRWSPTEEDAWDPDDGYDEDAEDGGDVWDGNKWQTSSDGEEDDSSDVMEMRWSQGCRPHFDTSTSSSSSPSPMPQRRNSSSTYHHHRVNNAYRPRSPLVRSASTDGHVTIAPIEPTLLKTSDAWLGDGLGERDICASDDGLERWIDGGNRAGRHGSTRTRNGTRSIGQRRSVELVYVPPFDCRYGPPMEEGEVDGEHNYTNRSGYLAGYSPVPGWRPGSPWHSGPSRVASPPHNMDDDGDKDMRDCIDGADPGEDYLRSRRQPGRRKVVGRHYEDREEPMTRFAEGGAASVVGGRSSEKGKGPQVIVSDEHERRGRELATRSGSTSRSRSTEERSRSRSRSRTPSPLFSPAVSDPRGRVPPTESALPRSSSPTPSALLSPPARGRSTTPTERGRTVSRGSGSSDRSGSRNGHSYSPMGNLSPEGSALGCAVYAQGRGRKGRRVVSLDEQGLGESLSRNGRGQKTGQEAVGREGEYSTSFLATPRDEGWGEWERDRSTSPLSGSSTASNQSTSTVSPSGRPSQDDIKPQPSISIPTVSLNTLEEEEAQRSCHPTPANSPVTLRPLALPSPNGTGREADSEQHENESLVGRAVDIMASAGAFLSSMW